MTQKPTFSSEANCVSSDPILKLWEPFLSTVDCSKNRASDSTSFSKYIFFCVCEAGEWKELIKRKEINQQNRLHFLFVWSFRLFGS